MQCMTNMLNIYYIVYILHTLKFTQYVMYKLNNYPPCVIDKKNENINIFYFFHKNQRKDYS